MAGLVLAQLAAPDAAPAGWRNVASAVDDGVPAGWRNVASAPEVWQLQRVGAPSRSLVAWEWTREGVRLLVGRDLEEVRDLEGNPVPATAGQALRTATGLAAVTGPRLAWTGDDGDDDFVEFRVELDGVRSSGWARLAWAEGRDREVLAGLAIDADGWLSELDVVEAWASSSHDGAGAGPTTPVPGTVTHVAVAVGDVVEAGAALVVLEAMKMEHTIRADADCVVTEIHVTVGQSVDAHTLVATLTPSGDPG
jgi:hypothetical protein